MRRSFKCTRGKRPLVTDSSDLALTPPEVSLHFLRLTTAAVSMLLLLYGLVWEEQ